VSARKKVAYRVSRIRKIARNIISGGLTGDGKELLDAATELQLAREKLAKCIRWYDGRGTATAYTVFEDARSWLAQTEKKS
jgi:hypothetical protein